MFFKNNHRISRKFLEDFFKSWKPDPDPTPGVQDLDPCGSGSIK
jgi:hypothetical protein